jgi:hypothetical protein
MIPGAELYTTLAWIPPFVPWSRLIEVPSRLFMLSVFGKFKKDIIYEYTNG